MAQIAKKNGSLKNRWLINHRLQTLIFSDGFLRAQSLVLLACTRARAILSCCFAFTFSAEAG